MRTQFVEGPNRAYALKCCPWAAKIVRVDGGWMCFESVADYQTWKKQQ